MCGILGMLAFGEMADKKAEKIRQESMIFLSSELLQLTQPRGRDATGIATLFANLDYMGLKMGIPSADFVSRFGGTEKDFDGYLNIWRKKVSPAKMILGHCRKSSVGNSEDNVNNHPIKVGDIVGVHNGTLSNHDRIFELLGSKRDGTVDSEAIFRLLHFFTKNGEEPFSPKVIQEVCKRLHGSYSCLSFSGNNPYQMIGFRDARPMEVLLIKPLKLMLIASDKDFLKHVVFKYNKMTHLYQTSSIKFPPLKKSDVELKSLADDTLYIFDIRKEVEDKTAVEDLYISEKVPRIDKIWDSKSGTSTVYTPSTGYKRPTQGTQSAENTKRIVGNHLNKPADSSTDKDARLGMAWSKQSNTYEDVRDIEKSRGYNSVEIDSKNGEVTDARTEEVLVEGKKEEKKEEDTQFKLKPTDKNIDNLITSHAKIETLEAPFTDTDTETTEPPEIENEGKTEVLLETYPEVLEKAGVALREESNFSNINEVRLALDIDNEEDLRRLPLYSLANRIKRFFYKKGWFDGYVSHLKENENSDTENIDAKKMLLRVNNKRKTAEKNIRIMKHIVHIFDRMARDYQIDDVTIDRAVDVELAENKELNMALIKNVFKPGDLKKAPILEKITVSVGVGKEQRP